MRANKILFPTDFSDKTYNALEYAINLAYKMSGEIIIFHSSHYPRYSSTISLESIERTYKESLKKEEHKLEEVVKYVQNRNSDIPCRCINLQGMATDNIRKLIKDEHIDLIVMATGGDGFMPGSITADLIEIAECPVFAIPSSTEFHNFERIIFASDLKDSDVPALCELSDLARAYDAYITVLNIAEEDGSDHYQKFLTIKEKVVKCLGYDRLEYEHTENKNVVRGLSEYTTGHRTDALVMATHKRKGLNRVFKPSMTKKMAEQTNVPLLALHL
ncbi:MAG: universal stress protein [Cytophagaceae bacterium]